MDGIPPASHSLECLFGLAARALHLCHDCSSLSLIFLFISARFFEDFMHFIQISFWSEWNSSRPNLAPSPDTSDLHLLQGSFISSFLFIGLAFRTLWSASILPIPSVWHHVFLPQGSAHRFQVIPKPTVVHVLFMRCPFPTLTVLFLTIDCCTSSWSLPSYSFKQPCAPVFLWLQCSPLQNPLGIASLKRVRSYPSHFCSLYKRLASSSFLKVLC